MTRTRKKITGWKEKRSGSVSLNSDELRTAGMNVGDIIEVEADRNRIVIYRVDAA